MDRKLSSLKLLGSTFFSTLASSPDFRIITLTSFLSKLARIRPMIKIKMAKTISGSTEPNFDIIDSVKFSNKCLIKSNFYLICFQLGDVLVNYF